MHPPQRASNKCGRLAHNGFDLPASFCPRIFSCAHGAVSLSGSPDLHDTESDLCGGGDAKLAAATALWLGWSSIFDYGVTAAIYGGILTLIILTARMMPLPSSFARFTWIARLHKGNAGVPYGIALAAAGLMQYPGSPVWAVVTA
jgi:prepilin signal peptidase PulO-like enzyme (type II secretory pathway)